MEVDDAIRDRSLDEPAINGKDAMRAEHTKNGKDEDHGESHEETGGTGQTGETGETGMTDKIDRADTPDDTDTMRCVICLDALSEPCVAQPCAHRHFDFLCLASWLLQQQPCCPLCKATVETVRYGSGLLQTLTVPTKVPERHADAATATAAAATAATPSITTPHPFSALRRTSRSLRYRRCRPLPLDGVSAASASASSLETALARRRSVYRLGLYALHVGANRHSRCYHTLTPQLFARDPDLVSRARTFMRRELQVFWPVAAVAPASTEFLIEYIVAILQTVDLQASSGQAEELLQGFFAGSRGSYGSRNDDTPEQDTADKDDRNDSTTRHFLHELRSFLRSPYLTLESWDRHVQYGQKQHYKDDDEDSDEGSIRSEVRERRGKKSTGSCKRPRGDCWRPRESDWDTSSVGGSHRRNSPGYGGSYGGGGENKRSPRAVSPQPLRSRKQHAAVLREACRRYDPS